MSNNSLTESEMAKFFKMHSEMMGDSNDVGDVPDFHPLPTQLEYRRAPKEATKDLFAPLDSIFMDGFKVDLNAPLDDDDLKVGEQVSCPHTATVRVDAGNVCTECGVVVGQAIDNGPEWSYYGEADTRHKSDPSRISNTHNRERKNDVTEYLISIGVESDIAIAAAKIYHMMSIERPFRGESKRHFGALFASVYGALQQAGRPLPPEMVNKYFNIKKVSWSKGIEEYVSIMKKRGGDLYYIGIPDLIVPILDSYYGQRFDWFLHVKSIADRMMKMHYLQFHKSSPQSVAAGLISWYLATFKPDGVSHPSAKELAEFTNLSQMNINKFIPSIKAVANLFGWVNETPKYVSTDTQKVEKVETATLYL